MLHHYFLNYIGYRLRRVFVIRLQFLRSRLSQQASLAIWLNWFTHMHQQGNLDSVYGGLTGYMFPTLELHSAAALFVILRPQCGTVSRRKSQILCFHLKHSSLCSKHICTINHSAVDRVTDPVKQRFAKCHFAERQFAECQITECCFAECQFAYSLSFRRMSICLIIVISPNIKLPNV